MLRNRILLARLAFILTAFAVPASYAGTLSLATPAASAGESVVLNGAAFVGGESITLRLDSHVVGLAAADSAGAFTTEVRIPSSLKLGDHTLQATGSVSGDTPVLPVNVGSNWPMYKNQTSRLGSNPFETTINRNNARRLELSWVGVMGDLVDLSSPMASLTSGRWMASSTPSTPTDAASQAATRYGPAS